MSLLSLLFIVKKVSKSGKKTKTLPAVLRNRQNVKKILNKIIVQDMYVLTGQFAADYSVKGAGPVQSLAEYEYVS